jgi:hypothetical protein
MVKIKKPTQLTTSASASGKSMRRDWKSAPKNTKTITPRKNKDE